jgi:hypothetical protein
MSLTRAELEQGVDYWRDKTRWPRDFHNDFYRHMADANPRGAFDDAWWAKFLPRLREWHAIRPRRSDFITLRAQMRFAALAQAWTLTIEPNLNRDLANVEWPDVAAFPALVAEIKDVASPVFTSKFCHFLAPAIFPVVDNAAMGNPFPTYEASFTAFKWEWLSTDAITRQTLGSRLTDLIDAPLTAGYPIKNKIVELCLIGRKHARGVSDDAFASDSRS